MTVGVVAAVLVLLVVGSLNGGSPGSTEAPSAVAAATTEPPSEAHDNEAPTSTAAPTHEPTEAPTPTAAPRNVWDRDTAVGIFEQLGYSGDESPLLDGTPRWLAQNDASSTAEVIGDPRVSGVSLTFAASQDAGVDLAVLVTTWMPSGYDWVVRTLTNYNGKDIDKTKKVKGGSIEITTLTATDGVLVVVSIKKG